MIDYVDAIRREGDLFFTTALAADPQLGVPSCPDWSISDLVWHLVEVHWFWGSIIERRIREESGLRTLDRCDRPGDHQELVALGRTNLDRLLRLLDSNDDATAVWTWASQRDVGFVRRHQVQETAVHRWDMQAAATTTAPAPIESAVASDAVDEFLAFSLPVGRAKAEPLTGTVHFHCTDTDGEWFIHRDGRVEPIHAKGDVAVRAGASDLLLALYARVDITDLDVIGDASLARQLIDSIDFE